MTTTESVDLDQRLADLGRQWQWAIRRAHLLGWELFPLNDRVRSGQQFRTDEDWSKRPRRRCDACRLQTSPTDTGGKGRRAAQCFDECGHRLCHGLLGATSDVDQLIEWAGRFPNANVGLRTGTGSDVFVLDVDGDTGLARLAELTAEHGDLPETLRHITGGGTPHYLFTYPTRNNPAHRGGEWRNNAGTLLGAGLDTRGEGGYVVLPGAVSRKGPYKIELNAPLAEAPGWLLDLLSTVRKAPVMTSERRRELAQNPRFDACTAPAGVHPYAAAAFTNRVEHFRGLVGEGNGRTYLLTGGAKYLSGLANATPPSGLTEEMVRDAFVEAAKANGYADSHSDWEMQLDRGIADGRTDIPRNWPPEEPMSEADRLMLDAITTPDPEKLRVMKGAFGPGWEASFRARWRDTTALMGVVSSTDTPAPETPAQGALEATGAPGVDSPAPAPRDTDEADGDVEAPIAETPDTATSLVTGPQPVTEVDWAVAPDSTPATEVEDGRLQVIVNGRDFAELRDEIARIVAITNAREPWLFQHGRNVALAGRTELTPCNLTLLTSRLADRCRFVNVRLQDGLTVVKPADPPRGAIEALLADGANLGLPEVDRVAHAPFFGPDGTLQREAGYHAKARTLLIPEQGVNVPDVPTHPTVEQVAAARHLLVTELLGDFPFAEPERTKDQTGPDLTPELAGAIALAITPFVRPMIDGPTPLFVIDAPDSRTGKGLLMEVLLRPSWGRGYHVQAAPTGTEEWAKTIVASLRSGPVAAVFDNANARIDSGALASAVTAYPLYTSRILGLSENVHMALPACWVATGNNVVASREIANRVVRCRIDAKMDNPGERPTSEFRHQNLRRWQTDNMGEIIAACITLVQAWLSAGRPHPESLAALGGFEDWIEVVGGILAHHRIDGLLTNRKNMTDTLTDDAADWNGLIEVMRVELTADKGRTEWTATELVTCLIDQQVNTPVDVPNGGGVYAGRALAKELRKVRDRRFGNHVLRMRLKDGTARWKLEPV